jgi:hypothetical protein
MNSQKTLPNFFSAGILSRNSRLLTVLHKKYSVTKLPGGTFNGDRKNWESRGEGDAFYNPYSSEDVIEKFIHTLIQAYGKNIFDSHEEIFRNLVQFILKNFNKPQELHLIIEMIEETGIIPVELELSLKQETAPRFFQYFYVVKTAYTYSKDQNKIIEVTDFDLHTPKDDEDFFCRDMDIEKTQVVNLEDAVNNYNFARKHKNAVHGFIINEEKK